MNDKREQRILKSGSILFDRSASIDCLARNVPETCALFEIEGRVGIPKDFILVISKGNVKRSCQVL